MRLAVTDSPQATIARYLPANYTAVELPEASPEGKTLIVGTDVAGWTLGYVTARLASGLHFIEEIPYFGPRAGKVPAK